MGGGLRRLAPRGGVITGRAGSEACGFDRAGAEHRPDAPGHEPPVGTHPAPLPNFVAAEYRQALRHHDYEDAIYLAGRFVEVIYQGGKVVQIETNSPLFVTHEGVFVGNHPTRVAAKYSPLHGSGYLYGPPNPDTGIGYNRYYEDNIKRGIAFALETSPHASFSPEDTVAAIVVHSPGRPVIARPYGFKPLPEDANPL